MYSICAILNKHQQGELYFDVKPDGTPIGQVVTEESLREVSQKIKNHIEPKIYPEINKVVLDGRDCIHVRFSGEQVPYFAYGIAKMRVADEDLTMSPEEITSLILKSGREGNRWENLIQDVQMAIFATSECLTFNDIQRHHGPVLNLVDIAESYIKSNIHWKVEFTGSRQRIEIPEIPVDAIREALLNSFCHKDYSSGESNEVVIFKDCVEIYNPGTFPEGMEPQDFIDKAEGPIRRNPKIARILYYSKDIESFGTGLKRIAETCESAGVRYEFQKKKKGFVVCFYRSEEDKLEKADKKPINEERKETIKRILKEILFLLNYWGYREMIL